MQVKLFPSIKHIRESDWDQLIHADDIFNKYHFHLALEVSNCIGKERSQIPIYLTIFENESLKAACVLYIKGHSYGEYIFDWSWADLYSRYGHNYYPKLIAQNPFTAATNRTFIFSKEIYANRLIEEIKLIEEKYECSSTHLLFLDSNEIDLVSKDYKIRESFQYHWINQGYKNFEDFLLKLKSRKAKQIRKERRTDLLIKEIGQDELNHYSSIFYKLYIQTIAKKNSYAYLNEIFFNHIFTNMSEEIKLIAAFKDDQLVAASLFFIGENKIYGRYWGALEKHKNLHFELCYYQGIELSIKNNIEKFEAGAQGEHKISRGFIPTKTYSAHKIVDENFRAPIYNFIDEESSQIDELFVELNDRLPFRST